MARGGRILQQSYRYSRSIRRGVCVQGGKGDGIKEAGSRDAALAEPCLPVSIERAWLREAGVCVSLV